MRHVTPLVDGRFAYENWVGFSIRVQEPVWHASVCPPPHLSWAARRSGCRAQVMVEELANADAVRHLVCDSFGNYVPRRAERGSLNEYL